MEKDEEFLEVNDLDWFASYRGGLLAHFATGGRGFVPDVVRKSISEYEEVYDYFHSITGGVEVEVVEGNLPVFNDSVQRERYLRSFVDMAGRGLFSHDVNDDSGYKLIAKPKKCREYCDLPVEVQRILHVLSVNESAIIKIDNIL
ncbi:hypothetical protein [Pseudomonas mandelii]|uniref:hypothetical protein n=1 Tax=Pseudomonas mandelii TaxID=75612 RepID=UPI0020A0A8AE|nr:hypothetical protein [Pseudomonas mandelii]MCO8314384.1 hypothetical protein [Pseudomonas mandelii]